MPAPSLPTTAAEIAQLLNGTLVGDGAVPLRRFSPIDKAGAEDLTFAENDRFLHRALQSKAGAVLAPKGSTSDSKTLICVEKPRVAFAKILPVFFPELPVKPGAHPSAVIHPDSTVHPSAQIGPHCVLEAGVEIGPGCVLEGHNYIGRGVSIGEGTRLFAQATVYAGCKIGKAVRLHSGVVVGSDGYGYVFDEGRHVKINQVGNVVIEDWVEIGANSTIDRGALGSTVIGEGTKIDNLVQIAHNVRIGRHCIIVAQTGIAGSATIGDYTTIAGQVGIAGHIKIGSGVTIAGQSGVMHSIPDGERWFGSPAVPDKQMKRQLIALQKLPDLIREFNALKKRFLK